MSKNEVVLAQWEAVKVLTALQHLREKRQNGSYMEVVWAIDELEKQRSIAHKAYYNLSPEDRAKVTPAL